MLEKRLAAEGELWLDDRIDPVVERDLDPYALAASLLERME